MKFKLLLLLSCVGASAYSMQSSLNLSNEALLNKLQALYARAEKQAPCEQDNDFFACAHPGCGFWSTDPVRYRMHAKSHNRANKRRLDDLRQAEAQEIAAILAALSLSEPRVIAALTPPQALQTEIVSPLLPPSPTRVSEVSEEELPIITKRSQRVIDDSGYATQPAAQDDDSYEEYLATLACNHYEKEAVSEVVKKPRHVFEDSEEELPIVTKRTQRVVEDSQEDIQWNAGISYPDADTVSDSVQEYVASVNKAPRAKAPVLAREREFIWNFHEQTPATMINYLKHEKMQTFSWVYCKNPGCTVTAPNMRQLHKHKCEHNPKAK